jgi:hypothetical protein
MSLLHDLGVSRVLIGFTKDSYRVNTEFVRRTGNPAGNFTSIGNQNLPEHL